MSTRKHIHEIELAASPSEYSQIPFKADLETHFSVRPQGDGSILRVEQNGFPQDPKADSFYQACERGWIETFENIRRYFSAGDVA